MKKLFIIGCFVILFICCTTLNIQTVYLNKEQFNEYCINNNLSSNINDWFIQKYIENNVTKGPDEFLYFYYF